MLGYLQSQLKVPYFYAFYEQDGVECLIIQLIEGASLEQVKVKTEA